MKLQRTKSGSVTVFLTILFLLFFSLLGVGLEHARVLSSDAYMRVAANSAAMTVYGDYIKELYEEYGLYGYGGFDGKTYIDLNQNFQSILSDNLATKPERMMGKYMNFYRLKQVNSQVGKYRNLVDKEEFYRQVEAYLKCKGIKDISKKVIETVSGQKDADSMQEKLSMTKDYESGKYNHVEAEEKQEISKSEREDTAGGNPLSVFSDMIRDGILSLVCDVNLLAKGSIESRAESNTEESDKALSGDEDGGAAEFLMNLLKSTGDNLGKNQLSKGKEKIEIISYANEQFASYISEKNKTVQYGIEYLIGGKKEEKSNLAQVVNRLLVLRMAVNFAYVFMDPVLQEKSLATATAIAGFTGMPPVIAAVQYTILLILAFEEACVDTTALLEGRQVPLLKTQENFKMLYEEICIGTKSLFRVKAGQYPKQGNVLSGSITYNEYLWFFLLCESEETIRERAYDLIQFDLRERFNQSFTIDNCVSYSVFSITYVPSYLFQRLPFLERSDRLHHLQEKNLEVVYGYENE